MSCLMVSHNKPEYCREAINSVLTQRYQDWHAVIIDSGVLYDQGYFDWISDERIQVVKSNETPALKLHKAMAPWCFNECFRRNLVNGDLVTYLCDDDIWYENAFETFVEFWKERPYVKAMYASQDVAYHDLDGNRFMAGERRATQIMGRAGNGPCMDCQVDYLQFCHTKLILSQLGGFDYWPEHRITETHADGVFMDKIGHLVPVYPIDIKVGQNRRTPTSTYTPSGNK